MVKKRKLIEKRRAQRARRQALQLLRSPYFFYELLKALKDDGLVGEERNALALFIVATSRILRRPLNAIVKGQSSSGKNWLVKRVLRLFPKDCVKEITSASKQSWNYENNELKHKVVFLQERNGSSGAVHPTRQLISEGKLVREVTVHLGRGYTTETYTTEGPIASISTTTQNRLAIDDETRHISLWTDESTAQTRKIVKGYLTPPTRLSGSRIKAWRYVQYLLNGRSKLTISFPSWFEKIADRVYVRDLRTRRYFGAWIEVCRMVVIINSFRRLRNISENEVVELTFEDFAVAACLFEAVFVESLHHEKTDSMKTAKAVEQLCNQTGLKSVRASLLAEDQGISKDKAYRMLRDAVAAGTVKRVNESVKKNLKLFASAGRLRFLPAPEEISREISSEADVLRIIHPITGKWIDYSKRKGRH